MKILTDWFKKFSKTWQDEEIKEEFMAKGKFTLPDPYSFTHNVTLIGGGGGGGGKSGNSSPNTGCAVGGNGGGGNYSMGSAIGAQGAQGAWKVQNSYIFGGGGATGATGHNMSVGVQYEDTEEYPPENLTDLPNNSYLSRTMNIIAKHCLASNISKEQILDYMSKKYDINQIEDIIES